MATATLTAVVQTVGATQATQQLNSLNGSAQGSQSSIKSLTKSLVPLALSFISVSSAVSGLRKLVSVSRQFDILNATLSTAVGSSEKAAIAFRELERFARETPFALDQSVTAFTKLVNLGLDPSEKALISFGNTASAMGKDLNQLIEAVADAATGEFERLKEFGIKAKSQGDEVEFTFKGVSTTVKKSADEIQGYLIELGEDNFAGAMALRVDTLDGAISNLEDQWDSLFRTVSSQGAGDIIEAAVRKATEALGDLESSLASGQIAALLDANLDRFDAWGGEISVILDDVSNIFDGTFKSILGDGEDLVGFLSDAFTELPENIRASIQIAVVEVAVLVDKAGVLAEKIKALFQFGGLPAFQNFDLEGKLKAIDELRLDSIGSILKERASAVKSFEDQVSLAISLKEKYESLQKAREKIDLGGLVELPATVAGPDASKVEIARTQLKQILALNNTELEEANRKESELLVSFSAVNAAKLGLVSEFEAARAEIEENAATKRAELADIEYQKEGERLEERNAAVISAGELLSSSVADGLLDVAKGQRSVKEAALDTIGAVTDSVVKSIVQQQVQMKVTDLLVKAGFVQAKTAEVATTTAQAGLNAFASTAGAPYPLNLAAPAAATAAIGVASSLGAGVIGAAAAREQGGQFSRGQDILVGERGPEIVQFPSSGRVRNQSQLNQDGGTQAPTINMVIIDQSEGKKEFDQSTDDEGRVVLLIRSTVGNDIGDPNSQISKGFAGSTNIQRAGR